MEISEGKVTPVRLMLSKKLDHIKIKANGKARKLPLQTVNQLHVGNTSSLQDLETPLDPHCVTLEFDSGECLTLRVDRPEKVDDLALSLQILVDAQH